MRKDQVHTWQERYTLLYMLYARIKDNRLYLFSFLFIFLVLDLELVVSMILYIIVTNCYIKDSETMMSYHMSMTYSTYTL